MPFISCVATKWLSFTSTIGSLFELLLIIDQAITKRVDEIKDTLDDHVSYGNVGVIEWLVSSNREIKKLFNKNEGKNDGDDGDDGDGKDIGNGDLMSENKDELEVGKN